jgi:hypothetical protein
MVILFLLVCFFFFILGFPSLLILLRFLAYLRSSKHVKEVKKKIVNFSLH